MVAQLEVCRRVERLTRLISPLLGSARGYIGVDLILGHADDGSEDCVIEINPRVTTSYLGLSAACTTNLAEEMWRIAEGEQRCVEFFEGPCSFRVDGSVTLTT